VGGGIRINYLKVGQGPKNLLFIPGAMGEYNFTSIQAIPGLRNRSVPEGFA
jgi:hypothetical protein